MLLKVVPLLKDGLSIRGSSEMVVACFTFAIILASKSQLTDNVLDGVMKAVSGAVQHETLDAGLICLAILTQQKPDQSLTKRVITKLEKINDLEARLQNLKKAYDLEGFVFAIIQGSLSAVRAEKQNARLSFVERLLFAELIEPPNLVLVIDSLLTLLKSADQDVSSASVRDSVVDLLRRLNDSEQFSPLLADAVKKSSSNSALLEASLQIMIDEPEALPADVDEMDVDSAAPSQPQDDFIRALKHVPQRTVDEHSFLSHSPSHLFKPLLEAFRLATQSKRGVQTFLELPLWRSFTAIDEPLFASFFVRVFSGPRPLQVRRAALNAVGDWLSKLADFDTQAILPYILLQLVDPAQEIRKAASEVLLAMSHAFPSVFVDGETFKQWGVKELYGSGNHNWPLTFVATKDVSKIMERAVIPILEECVLEPTQIQRAIKSALGPSSGSNHANVKTPSVDLKKYLRQSFFRLILTHISSTPLYSVKVGLLGLLADIEKVGGIQKQKGLMSLLLHWASLTHEEVEKLASSECLNTHEINMAVCSIVSSTEHDAVEILLGLTSNPKRSDFTPAVSERIQSLWPQLSTDQQIRAADSLLDLMFDHEAELLHRSQIGRHVFQSVDLSTVVLAHILDKVLLSLDAMKEYSPASKRRRNNENRAVPLNKSLSEAKITNVSKLTFVLELIDNTTPEWRPDLSGNLFNVLVALNQLRLQNQSGMSYLLSLSLGILLRIFRDAASHSSKVDFSTVRLDVIIDCMHASSSHQVQNTSLLLIVAVASMAPELVLDSIIPVFTFMGTTVLGRDDEYSNYVVDQTMDKVIPPLIESFRNRGQDLIAETSDLTFSFAVAYEHIPPHRRLRLFKKLVSNLGDVTFLWVLISSLTRRYRDQVDVVSFIVGLVNTFGVDVQLKTCENLVVHVQDALTSQSGRPTTVAELEDANDSVSPSMILSSLRTLNIILTQSNIRSKLASSNQSVKTGTDVLMPLWKVLLGRMICLVQTPDLDDELSAAANDVLSSLLSLVPALTFIDIAEHFIHAEKEIFGRRVLRLLEARLHAQYQRSPALQTKTMSFLQTLYRVLKESGDKTCKHAAIACVDRICEIYGRKDIPAVVEAARLISGDSCLGSSDTDINNLALLSLSSMAEIAKDAMVPIIPQMMPKIFGLLQLSLEEDSEDFKLHNATFSLVSALIVHVPFIISDEYLDQIIAVSAESRNSALNVEAHDVRGQCLQLIGKNIELAKIVGSLQRTWATTIENDVSAVQQALSLLENSVKVSSKSTIVKNVDKLSSFLLQAFDLRRVQFTNRTEDSYTDTNVSEVERNINTVAIEIIYKLSDTTFRPIFLQLADWATKCLDLNPSNLPKAQRLRTTTFFKFTAHFFNTLKSIVTSYATHIVEPAIAVLNDIPNISSKHKPKSRNRHPSANDDKDTIFLYLATLSALSTALTHDHNAHFSNPSLFTPLAESLVAQLHLASHPAYTPHTTSAVLPTIVKLATAVVDTPEHLKKLNSLICALRRAEHREVRLASVRVHLALAGTATQSPADEEDGGDGREPEGEEGVGIAEEWCGTVLSVGEGMVYVNEMLEDEDEEVEAGIRTLVRRVRNVLGEEGIFE